LAVLTIREKSVTTTSPDNEPRGTTRLDALLAKREQIERQLKALAARQNAAKRKALARVKFLLGQAALNQAASEPSLLERLCADLSDKERALVREAIAQGEDSQD
jgi:hypothetical protein